jgi:Phage terminase small subunit
MNIQNTWDRQPGESTKAFSAFRLYLEAGYDRSVQGVAQKLAKSTNTIKKWAAAFNWVARTSDYVQYMAEVTTKEKEKHGVLDAAKWAARLSAQREETYRLSEALHEKAASMLEFPLEDEVSADGRTIRKAPKWNYSDIVKLITLAETMERSALGLDTDPRLSGAPTTPSANVVFYIPEKRTVEECELKEGEVL